MLLGKNKSDCLFVSPKSPANIVIFLTKKNKFCSLIICSNNLLKRIACDNLCESTYIFFVFSI